MDVRNGNKLRTYITFKKESVLKNMLILSQIDSTNLLWPNLEVETGRFQNIPLEYRLCGLCNKNAIETESHFLLFCNSCDTPIVFAYLNVYNTYPHFDHCTNGEKLSILMSHEHV